MKDNTITVKLSANYRIVVISDIHGHLDVFNALLQEAALQPDDYLVIIGDFINKGPDSLAMLRKMMRLSQRNNTIILKGNHEYYISHHMYGSQHGTHFLNYLKGDHFQTIIHDTVADGQMTLDAFDTMEQLIDWHKEHYWAEYDFINTLPVIAFMDDLTFVHGGYSKEINLASDEGKLLKFDDYNRLSSVNEGPVIVGHWPTANLRTNKNTNVPYFNHQKNIITIDGGMGVKSSGELNALIITKEDGQRTFTYLQANHFEKKTILASYQFEEEDKIFVNYPHFDIEIIEVGNTFTKCLHMQSGKELSIFNSLLETVNGKPQVVTTYINHFLNLEIGQVVELVMLYDDCALVKHKEEFGWILRHQI